MVYAAFDAFLQREGLVRACDDYDDFAGLEHGLDADCEGHFGDFLKVVAEEA